MTLLSAGTTYYLFLGMFSIIAFAYGLTAALGTEQLATFITEAVANAFPGLIGQGGIDRAQLRTVSGRPPRSSAVWVCCTRVPGQWWPRAARST